MLGWKTLVLRIYLWISMFVNLIRRKKQAVNIEPKSVTGLTAVQSSTNYPYFVGWHPPILVILPRKWPFVGLVLTVW